MADVEKKEETPTVVAAETVKETKQVEEDNETPPAKKAKIDDVVVADADADAVKAAPLPPSAEADETNGKDVAIDTKQPDDDTTDKDDSISKLDGQIIRQIEYYFGDANLSRDKFLLAEIAKDAGWVPLTVLLTFKRLASLSTDPAVIVAAVQKSDECLVEVSEDKTKLRRHPDRPLIEQNEETRKETISRTLYVKGLPATTEMSKLIDFFMPYEKVTNIVMRKYLDKPTKTYKFKGSAFVTFATKEQGAEFLKKDKIIFDGIELIRKWQSEYYEGKKEERQSEKAKNEKLRNKNDAQTIDLPKGAVIHLDGLGETITREDIKKVVTELGGEVAYIDYSKGDKSGHVRLSVENSAKPIVDKLTDSKMKIGESEATARVIDGDEETEFLATVVTNMKSRRNQSQQNRHKGGRNNFNNRKRNN